jgi:NADH:ubiquinone oxidoreductase subunit E
MPSPTLTLTQSEISAVQTILRRYRNKGGSALLPCLHDVQAVTGWLDENTCSAIAKSVNVPLVQVHNVIEFYALFYNRPVGKRIVRVCDDMPCYLAGSQSIVRACSEYLDVAPEGGTTEDGEFTLEIHPCLGHCEQAPYLMIDDDEYGDVVSERIPEMLGGGE